MFNNRKYINQLMREIENLKEENKKLKVANKVRADESDFWIKKYYEKNQENKNLKKDVESKENSVCNLLEANKELSLSNNYLENKIKLLEKVIREHEENECRLNTELCRSKGQLEKLRNVYKMQTGIDILEGEE